MITIDIDPNLHFGALPLTWHGIFAMVGVFLGLWLATTLVRPRVDEADAIAVGTWGVAGGLVGARILHVLDCWTGCGPLPDGYAAHPDLILQIWTGGIAVWGAAIGGVVGGLVEAIRRGTVPIGFSADAAAPALALGFAVGRIGDIINGEHHATACAAPLGICVGYTNPATLGQPGPVHLAVAYDMVWNILAVIWALALRGRDLPDGIIFWLWLAWYAMGRFALGFMRVGEPTYAFGLREDQAIGILALAAAAPMIVSLWRRRSEPAAAS